MIRSILERNPPSGSTLPPLNRPSSSTPRFGIVNRPRLILRCDHGFMGCKKGADSLQCNLPKYEAFTLEHTGGAKETHRIKGSYIYICIYIFTVIISTYLRATRRI